MLSALETLEIGESWHSGDGRDVLEEQQASRDEQCNKQRARRDNEIPHRIFRLRHWSVAVRQSTGERGPGGQAEALQSSQGMRQ